MVWEIGGHAGIANGANRGEQYIVEEPVHILYGHDDEVSHTVCMFEFLVSACRDKIKRKKKKKKKKKK